MINASTFEDSSISSIVLPAHLTAIGAHAFSGANIVSITIPPNVTSIGDNAFDESSLTCIKFLGAQPAMGQGVFAFTDITNVYALSGMGFGDTFYGLPVTLWGPRVASGVVVNGTTNLPSTVDGTIDLGTMEVGSHASFVTTNDARYLAALTNAAAFATAEQGTKADTALQPASTNGWVVTSHDSLLATNGNGSALTGITAAQVGAVATNAPAWIAATNTELSVTITNDQERPQYLYATGAVTLAFSGLRPPQPFYLIVKGPDSLTFPGETHFVGGASWQTNMANHFIVWQYGTNLFCNPVTTSED
jgi:hypothetical protein